jgi:hypothetical protein
MPTAEAEELTAIDGVDRPDAELVFAGPPEDWAEQANEIQADLAGKMALDDLIASKVAEQVAKILASMNAPGPAKVMVSKVGDRFVGQQGTSGGLPVLKHYRCDAAHAHKVAEIDMDLLEAYESGARERPTNERGRPTSSVELAVLPGKWIEWIEGHCYCHTDNQVRNVERLIELNRQGLPGGMPGIYEDTGTVAENWQCFVCQHQPKLPNQETYNAHMWATHGVAPEQAA